MPLPYAVQTQLDEAIARTGYTNKLVRAASFIELYLSHHPIDVERCMADKYRQMDNVDKYSELELDITELVP